MRAAGFQAAVVLPLFSLFVNTAAYGSLPIAADSARYRLSAAS
jgi:hypothetical protein